ncbi:flagellar assembly peptidoglycan hydrolase FlgJ [Variovorax sp. YR752]|uniref:flagellar assembly peptidoglycan hydrolase FlgJ n=1 Tax=Variovorax sp. YR752 TaxID=1884383 RepID=UPI003137E506
MAINGSSPLAADTRSIDALRASASKDPKAAIKEAAKQFEALFMQQIMKSMREATMSSGMLDNSGTQMGTEMLDTQFATKMTGLPGGLSEVIARQLERQMSGAQPAIPTPTGTTATPPAKTSASQADFVQKHSDAARAAEAQTGIPAAFMVAQAAHESGWGKREIRNADGSSSNNLFGIKAGPSWKGAVAEVTTTEYVDGQPRKVTAKFRAYPSAADSFADYARLMKTSPRYTGVLANATSAQGFAQGLQNAGYATDPAYADKLARTINTTLRLQRAMS